MRQKLSFHSSQREFKNVFKEEEERNRAKETKYLDKKVLLNMLNTKRAIIDIGCGWGFWTKKCEKYCSLIVGVYTRNIFYRTKSSKLHLVLAEGLKLPFKDEAFDAAISFEVIEHVQDDLNFLKEAARVLKEGAPVLLTTPNKGRLANQIKKIIGKPTKYPLCLGIDHYTAKDTQDQWHFREYSKNDIIELFKKSGFDEIKIKGLLLGLGNKGLLSFPHFLERFARTWIVKAIRHMDYTSK